ncbi:hypothetical protein [Paenibacillus sp. FSL H7-0331]|uniref:hypothetical protein n=1 Tax=Paenibacillus sp. FSL H7-0331 TaxID=1920421 RepID=UPI0015C376B5|nr:hypothetical protein [Paenibacillus sp. FSL H7-0331]
MEQHAEANQPMVIKSGILVFAVSTIWSGLQLIQIKFDENIDGKSSRVKVGHKC